MWAIKRAPFYCRPRRFAAGRSWAKVAHLCPERGTCATGAGAVPGKRLWGPAAYPTRAMGFRSRTTEAARIRRRT